MHMGRSPSTGPGSPRWSPRLEEASPSKHQGIFDALVADIASGRLRPGDRLPPQRAVAAALGVDLTTVTKAYSRAREEGIIDATTGRGSFVAGEPRPASTLADVAAGAIDLSRNSPPKPQDFQRILARDIGQALSGSDESLLDYQETGGSWTNRSAGATWLGQRVDGCPPDRVILASGAQSALFAICHLLCRASRHVAVGEFCYPGIHTVAAKQDLVLVPLAMDGEGILPAAFEDACRLQPIDALYITPTADNPTTASLSEARRQEIVRIARKHAVSIIEDDPYGALIDAPPTAIASLGPDITWYIATLSKCLTPALRFGYVAAPSPEQALELAATLQAMTMMASPLLAGIATRWIRSGFLREMSAAIGAENTDRQELAASIFYDTRLAANPSAPHLWMSLPNPWRAVDFVRQLEHRGVLIVAGSSFSITSPSSEAVRISLGAARDREVLETALRSIRSVLSQPPPDTRRAIV